MGRAVGIDLGTTNSCVAVWSGGRAAVIADEEGCRTTPSAVAVSPEGTWLVGRKARAARDQGSGRAMLSVKRLMGRSFADVASDLSRLGCSVRERSDRNLSVKVGNTWFTPQEVSARILMRMKEIAEIGLQEVVESAVITVPAYFDQQQRRATQHAARIAGLEVLRIINEPTAAAMAYGLDRDGERKLAVFDLGGGTFDVSVLAIREGLFEVLATAGDTHLGGDDLDWLLAQHLSRACERQTAVDPLRRPDLMPRLVAAAERAKITLSAREEVDVRLDLGGGKAFHGVVTRREFEGLIEPLLARAAEICRRALGDARLTARDIDDLVLVGGSTRIPRVRKLAAELFAREPRRGVNPDEVVAIGAAVQAGLLTGSAGDALLLDVVPLSLGLETQGGVFRRIIPRQTKIPVRCSEIFSTAESDQTAVNVHILQGEREMAEFNRSLGRFQLEGIDPAPRGVPRIEVTFEIDANGLLRVAAQNLHTGEAVEVDVNETLALGAEEVARMIEEARRHHAADGVKRERAVAASNLKDLAAHATTCLERHGDGIPSQVRREIGELLRQVDELCRSAPPDRIRMAGDRLFELCAPLRDAEREARRDGPTRAGRYRPVAAAPGGGERR